MDWHGDLISRHCLDHISASPWVGSKSPLNTDTCIYPDHIWQRNIHKDKHKCFLLQHIIRTSVFHLFTKNSWDEMKKELPPTWVCFPIRPLDLHDLGKQTSMQSILISIFNFSELHYTSVLLKQVKHRWHHQLSLSNNFEMKRCTIFQLCINTGLGPTWKKEKQTLDLTEIQKFLGLKKFMQGR